MRYYLVVEKDVSGGVTCHSVEAMREQVASWADEYCDDFYNLDNLFADVDVMEIPDTGDVVYKHIKDYVDYRYRSPYVIVKKI